MRQRATFVIAIILATTTAICRPSRGEHVTWAYTGVIQSFPFNTIGFPSPVGLPVKFNFTFDKLTPDSLASPFEGIYLMSGGATGFNVQIGDHISDPINAYSIHVLPQNCCATPDKYLFLNNDGATNSLFLPINFPGYLEDGIVYLRFETRLVPGPITSKALPTAQLNPADFQLPTIAFRKFVGTSIAVQFSARLDAIPEPTSLGCLLGGLAGLIYMRRRRWLR